MSAVATVQAYSVSINLVIIIRYDYIPKCKDKLRTECGREAS